MTAVWLLPVVTLTTLAPVGAGLAQLVMDEARYNYATVLVVSGYVLGGLGFLLAATIMILYFQRLALHRLPSSEIIVSTFLPLGPCGQFGYALIVLVSTTFCLIATNYDEAEKT